MALVYSRALGDSAPNFVELDNNPDQSSPWTTNYSEPQGTVTIGPIKITPAKGKAKASSKKTTATSATKIQITRPGAAGALLDKLLPLVADQAGNRTIYGLPPVVVYLVYCL